MSQRTTAFVQKLIFLFLLSLSASLFYLLSLLFCSAFLFCFVLFCFVLFCFVLFCFVLFCFVLFCFVLFCFVFSFFHNSYDSGCILYVMCAGCLPFPEDGELLDQKIVMGSWIAPAHFSSNLKALLVRLMEPDWRRRYSSINQIRSHNWVRDVKELVIPVPMAIKDVPTRLSDKGKV